MVEDQSTSWGSTFQDTFSKLVDAAANKYLAPDSDPQAAVTGATVEQTSNANAVPGKTGNQKTLDFFVENQTALIVGFGGLLVLGLILRK
jgi:hypothetical protein